MRTSTKIPQRKQPVPIRPKPISSIPHLSMTALKRPYSLILPQTGIKTLQPVLLPMPLLVKATPLYPFPEIRSLLSQPSPMKSSSYHEPSQTPAMYQCTPKFPTIPTNVSSFYDGTGESFHPAPACLSFDVCLKTLTYDITTEFVVSEGPEATPKTTSPGATPNTTSPEATLLELGPINELPAYVPVVVSLILSCARDWFDVLFICRLN